MAGVLLKYILILLINQHFDVEGIYQGWQLCDEKCYHLGLANVTFIDQSNYCNSLSSYAQPVRYGQALSTKLSMCALKKLDEEPYWIRRHDSQNHKTLTCHTLSFSGNNVHMVQTVSCSTFSHPFCETDKSFCLTSTKSNTDITVTNVPATAGSSDWQPCLDKCYYMSSKMHITFEDQASYCHVIGRGSKPVDFGSKLEQSLAFELATCRFVKVDNEPYWINDITASNIGTSTCRTITFSGSNIHIDPNVPCSSMSHPFCEAEKSYCQTSASNTTTLTSHWVSVAGQRSFYKLSSSAYPYCEAKDYCEGTELGKIAKLTAGNFSFMGLLATQLGITLQTKVDFWLESRGISCPSGHGSGKVMRYTGPMVHLIEHRKATEDFRVLCRKDNSILSIKTISTTQLLKTTQLMTHSATRSTPATPNTFIPQIYTVSPTTQQGVPTTTPHQSSSRTRKQTISTTRQQSALTAPQQFASTTYPPVASVTRQQSTLTSRPQAASTTTQQAVVTTAQQAASTTTQQAVVTTTQQAALTTTQQAASTTTQQTTSTTTQQQPISTTRRLVTKPAAQSSVPGQMTAKKLAVSTKSGDLEHDNNDIFIYLLDLSHTDTMQVVCRLSSFNGRRRLQVPLRTLFQTGTRIMTRAIIEPEWLKVGVKEYFINYESEGYRRNENISTNYIKILPNSNADSFWIGAHTVQDEELSDVGMTYVPYKNEPVRFSLTKEQVQAMWKELRQRRDANKKLKPPSGG